MVKIGFIGAGVVGTALAVRLKEKGYTIAAVSSRTLSSAQRLASLVEGCSVHKQGQEVADNCEFVFLTVPDDAIAEVCASVNWREGHKVAHCSGALSIEVLKPAKEKGAQVGSFHPLQTFASTEQAILNLPGSTFAIEGEGEILEELKSMASALNGEWIILRPEDKPLYHLSAVLACNYWITLVKLSSDIWQSFGIPPAKSISYLLPLLKGTLNNLERLGLPYALTGPISRGDIETIKRHIKALKHFFPSLLPLYLELGRNTIPIALAKGRIREEKAKEMIEILGGER